MNSEPTLELTSEEVKMLPAFPPKGFTKEQAVKLVKTIREATKNDK